ncbi:MAG: AraC family transcriptional regulator [Acetobacteraceae bacterium]|nr:AraC family transcriptional regulator [Acetobacteraceae bacterium]
MDGHHRVGVAAELLPALLALGVDPKPILAEAGVPPELLRNPENMIAFTDLGRLLEVAIAASGCPHIGMLAGLRGGLASLGLVGRLMATAPTLREAILDLCTNQVRYIHGAVSYLTVQDGVGLWGYLVQTAQLPGIAAIMDGAMAVGDRCTRQLCGERPEAVRLSHAAPADTAPYWRGFGVMPSFDAEQSCMVIGPRLLGAKVATADPVLRRILQRQVAEYWARAQPSVAERVRRSVAAYLTTGEAVLEPVAAALDLGPRTLNRRLQAEGTSFREILEVARHDVACQLLGGTWMTATEISTALGYATPSGFVRAFRRMEGRSPSEWRQAARHTA